MDDFEKKRKEELDKQRKRDLELKKQKLEELRKAKQTSAAAPAAAKSEVARPVAPPKQSIDDLVNSVLSETTPSASDASSSASSSSSPITSPLTSPIDGAQSLDSARSSSSAAPSSSASSDRKKAMSKLSMSAIIASINIASKTSEYYDKSVQTESSSIVESSSSSSAVGSPADDILPISAEPSSSLSSSDSGIKGSVAAAASASSSPASALADLSLAEATALIASKELSAAERKEIITSDSFQHFFGRASKMVERALHQPFDVLVDYSDVEAGATGQRRESISLNCRFSKDRLTTNRTITSVQWSEKHPELLLASYHSRSDALSRDADGLVLLWSLLLPSTPEYTFTCQSPVSCAIFSPFSPHIILGGTYSGQIAVWDMRVKSTPIHMTPLSPQGHTYPIFGLEVVGTEHSNNLVTLSTDGRFCVWSMEKLTTPQETLDLVVPASHQMTKVISGHALAFPPGDMNRFVVGSDDGSIWSAHRHGSKQGLNEKFGERKSERVGERGEYLGHTGTITSIDFHPQGGSADFSDLFLSSGMDWSVKLWSQKSHLPLASFEDYDEYIYDARWSPAHPGLFATADGAGRVLLWNLNEDMELPVHSCNVASLQSASVSSSSSASSSSQSVASKIGGPASSSSSSSGTVPTRPINRLRWSADGSRIAVGDSGGCLHILDISADVATPQGSDWGKLESRLFDLQHDTPLKGF